MSINRLIRLPKDHYIGFVDGKETLLKCDLMAKLNEAMFQRHMDEFEVSDPQFAKVFKKALSAAMSWEKLHGTDETSLQ